MGCFAEGMEPLLGARTPMNRISGRLSSASGETKRARFHEKVRRIPFFLSMQACPRRCVYCHQGEITGVSSAPSPDEVRRVLASLQGPHEVCFFGGSFTCFPPDLRNAYLDAVFSAPSGSSVRFSTHPECISSGVLDSLARFPVSMIELGISSLDDRVLKETNRGYTGDQALSVMKLVSLKGYRLAAQMMIGLPGQTTESSLEDLRKISSVPGDSPITLRIYPCLVLRDTPLSLLLAQGRYSPLSVEEAASWAGMLLSEAKRLGFAVQRIGLQHTESLAANVVAGPYHPALGEMAQSVALVTSLLSKSSSGPWKVERNQLSLLHGHGKFGIRLLSDRSGLTVSCVERRIGISQLTPYSTLETTTDSCAETKT